MIPFGGGWGSNRDAIGERTFARALPRRRQELHRQVEWLALLLSTILAVLTFQLVRTFQVPSRGDQSARRARRRRIARPPPWSVRDGPRSKRSCATKTGQPNSLSTVSIRWPAVGSKSRAP